MVAKKVTEEDFIVRAHQVHGSRYTYNNIGYRGYKTKIMVGCRLHGNFFVTPKAHCYQGSGCPSCGKVSSVRRTGKPYLGLGVNTKYRANIGSFRSFERKLVQLPFYLEQRCKDVHNGKYTYEFVDKVTNIEKDYITVICQDHGKFKQTIKSHLRGQGCKTCGKVKAAISKTTPYKEFLLQANKVHKEFYTYKKSSYLAMTSKIEITCPYHGNFIQSAMSHVKGTGCPYCSKLVSGSSPNSFKGIPTLFYVLSLVDGNYKIGITTKKELNSRYTLAKDRRAIRNVEFLFSFMDGFDARTFELVVIKQLKPFGYKGESIMTTKTTEMFTIDPTDIIQQLLIKQTKEYQHADQNHLI